MAGSDDKNGRQDGLEDTAAKLAGKFSLTPVTEFPVIRGAQKMLRLNGKRNEGLRRFCMIARFHDSDAIH